MELMGGEIGVDRLDTGSCFWIRLPQRPQAPGLQPRNYNETSLSWRVLCDPIFSIPSVSGASGDGTASQTPSQARPE
jgi:hypothetical protein